MKTFASIIFLVAGNAFAADSLAFPELPDSPRALIEALRSSDEFYTVEGRRLQYVKESDLPYLIELLDSKEPCAHVVEVFSSVLPNGRSTVGHEAAYLIEGFWKRYYPTGLTSQRYEPDMAEIKRWYSMWNHLRNREHPSAENTTNGPAN